MAEIISLPVKEDELDTIIMCLENEKGRLEQLRSVDGEERYAGLEAALGINELLDRFIAIRGEV